MRGKWIPAFGILLLAGITAGGLIQLRRRTAPEPRPRPEPVAAVFSGSEASLPGRVRARTVVSVPAPVEGIIDLLEVEAGDSVYEGQLLGHIKNTGFETSSQTAAAELEQAQTRVNELQSQLINARAEAARDRAEATRAQGAFEAAQRAFDRQQVLFKAGATPRLVYQKAEQALKEAQTEFDTLSALASASEDRASTISRNLANAQAVLEEKKRVVEEAAANAAAAGIHSPVDGVVIACTKGVGDEVSPAVADLFQIAVDLSELEAVVDAAPPVLARIREGQEAMIIVAELPDAIPATVAGVQSGQIIVRFTSPSAALLPGASVHVRIKL